MSKTKKIIFIVLAIVVLAGVGYWAYFKFIYNPYVVVEEAGINNLSGQVISFQGDKLSVSAQVPTNYKPFSNEDYKYAAKDFVLNISPETQVLIFNASDEAISNDLAKVSVGDLFSAIASENVLKNENLNIKELNIYKK